MSFAIELGKRQSNRIIEQALRRQAQVMLETRFGGGDRPIVGELVRDRSGTIALVLQGDPGMLLDNLIGVYADAHLQLGDCRYLFSTHIIEVTANRNFGRLTLACPETILVVQRRRFWRMRFAESSVIKIVYDTDHGKESVLGALCNISPGGLAMKLDVRLAEGLLIGEAAEAHFKLPSLDRPFRFDAIVCNKTPAGSPESIILGVQFTNVDPSGEQMTLLRNHLRADRRIVERQEAKE